MVHILHKIHNFSKVVRRNPYKQSILFVRHIGQTAQTQIRRNRKRRLMKFSTVWLQNDKIQIKMKNTTHHPLKRNGLFYLIRVYNAIWLKWVNMHAGPKLSSADWFSIRQTRILRSFYRCANMQGFVIDIQYDIDQTVFYSNARTVC